MSSSVEYGKPYVQYIECDEDLSPSTATVPRSSVDTYASTDSSDEDEEEVVALEREGDLARGRGCDYIPPLPSYYHEITEPNVLASTPREFAELYPSMDRLSIRHDDFTTDGNMNLRVDTMAAHNRRNGKRVAVQLFHLRMYDLAKREFSLRRYCRESGREVCNSKRREDHDVSLSSNGRPTLQRSMSTAMKSLARPHHMRRHNSSGGSSSLSNPAAAQGDSTKRPATSHSDTSVDAGSVSSWSSGGGDHHKQGQPRPSSNAIKLEFSNYARVDVERKGSNKKNTRYEFAWWGHKYMWKRVVEKHLEGVVSFHLIRDGQPNPVAHIVPETRSPNQVEDDERAGGWVPPCFMWINDHGVLDAATDVADVIMASGLMALVDDCIRERWQTKKSSRIPVLGEIESTGPRAFMHRVFTQRRSSGDHHNHHNSPLRNASPIPAF
ncbi:hypothetical protein M406DRAFT_254393 [Cryphonectria parasitica EP155]|uniref:Uncharacterized protein n=1 Tax=Cryphonectria parasitica (strain ATCC 38755 / EP155) TaxID=660469 RepID=A0A9P5CRW8_CRYP1|nr:uncharacterized protein M406DRAFT_254393 [Cryphonectria parasitica EP155]KAF3767972.1 hypothetical protein M406DRAFT_254393 [Cryphonectria parasitica EP155]